MAPLCNAFADVIATDMRLHVATVKLPLPVAQQFGGLGPEIVADIPVVKGASPQLVLITTVPVTGVSTSSRILSVIPKITAPAGS